MSETAKTGDSDATSSDESEKTAEAKSLTELLKEFDSGEVTDDKGKTEDKTTGKDQDRLARLESLRDNADFSALVDKVKGDLDVDHWYCKAWVMNEVANDPRMDKLWDSREFNQATLDQIVNESLKPGFKKHADGKLLPSKDLDPDPTLKPKPNAQQKLGAAVRAARDTDKVNQGGFDAVDWSSLSDADFQTEKQNVFRAAKSGQLK